MLHWPPGLASIYAQEHGITEPPGGLQIESGIPIPLLIVMGVTIFMTFISTRRRYGRDVYAYGGNPTAAELAGINTRWTIMKTFIRAEFTSTREPRYCFSTEIAWPLTLSRARMFIGVALPIAPSVNR